MEERELYHRGKVVITPSKFIVSNKSYAIKNIALVTVETLPVNKVPLVLVLVAGVLIMLVRDMLLIGAAIVAVGVVFYVLMKDEYSVRIAAVSGDSADTFTSNDRAEAEEVASALNEAIGLSAYTYYTNEDPKANGQQYIKVEPVHISSSLK
jgi:preprotein translocase subunit SecG